MELYRTENERAIGVKNENARIFLIRVEGGRGELQGVSQIYVDMTTGLRFSTVESRATRSSFDSR